MTYVSQVAGVLFIAGWNLVSVFLEYFLLLRVFKTVSCLSKKIFDTRHETSPQNSRGSPEQSVEGESHGSRERLDWMEQENNEHADSEALVPTPVVIVPKKRSTSGLSKWKKRILTFRTGWRLYMKQSVARPGLALACLYFTVLSFGAITTGYAYTQHLSESLLSIIRGVGSLFGIIATFVFPPMRTRLGLVRTGLFSMSLQCTCLLFCLAAVFAPGSPFFLLPGRTTSGESDVTSKQPVLVSSCHTPSTHETGSFQNWNARGLQQLPPNASVRATPFLNQSSGSIETRTVNSTYSNTGTPPMSTKVISNTASASLTSTTTPHAISPTPSHASSVLSPSSSVQVASPNCTAQNSTETPHTASSFSFISISLFLAGIVTSRLGLWLSDLTITQLQQETIPEQERGIVGGMQSAFQSAMDLVMFGLVIALPKPEHFGLLSLLSIAAVGIGALLYASFAYKVRGHLFHVDKLRRVFCAGQPSALPPRSASEEDLALDDEEEAMIRGVLSTKNDNFAY